MAYIDHVDLLALLPAHHQLNASVDGDGTDLMEEVCQEASDEVDSLVGGRYPTPFSAPVPKLIVRAAKVLAVDLLFARRGVVENAFSEQAKQLRSLLGKVATGAIQLDVTTAAAEPELPAGSVITYDSPLGEPTRRLM